VVRYVAPAYLSPPRPRMCRCPAWGRPRACPRRTISRRSRPAGGGVEASTSPGAPIAQHASAWCQRGRQGSGAADTSGVIDCSQGDAALARKHSASSTRMTSKPRRAVRRAMRAPIPTSSRALASPRELNATHSKPRRIPRAYLCGSAHRARGRSISECDHNTSTRRARVIYPPVIAGQRRTNIVDRQPGQPASACLDASSCACRALRPDRPRRPLSLLSSRASLSPRTGRRAPMT